ncbi:UNVERIFIED_CONTAM: protein CHLOROPLAST IMPORT APPARATUS 2 [Sesamum calycinum]|uniref:Protein CHLOROPLAST IMPORT APPARATUS 2 n=1 Tax=Sesamum calycinum TaxID=2727403 RepID=A0AAW2N2C1_9LAMI
MSSCLSGGGRAYRLELDIFKSPTTSWTSNSSSPSSTLSESSNSPLTISTRKARTPRKRPNQTYNEAAAILSTAYPKLFPTKHLTKPCKFTKSHNTETPFLFEPSDLFMPFPVIDNSEYLLHYPPILERPNSHFEPKGSNPFEKPCQSPGEINSQGSFLDVSDEYEEDFDAESILDEEIEEGIDSIMGKLSMENEPMNNSSSYSFSSTHTNTCCYGYPVGLGFDLGHGIRRELRAMRNVDKGDDWWRFPSVNVGDITQKLSKIPVNKKKKNVEKKSSESARQESFPGTEPNKEQSASTASSEESIPRPNAGLLLKLNYDNIMNAWSDRGSPFYRDAPGAESAGNDVQARLEQIDLFPENRGGTGATVPRCKEKQRTRVSSKKIGYQVRKVNANRWPRTKGKFARAATSSCKDEAASG